MYEYVIEPSCFRQINITEQVVGNARNPSEGSKPSLAKTFELLQNMARFFELDLNLQIPKIANLEVLIPWKNNINM